MDINLLSLQRILCRSLHEFLACSHGIFTFLTSQSALRANRLVLRLLYVFRICLFVCASALITCAVYYVIRYYATAAFGGLQVKLQQINEGSCVLSR